MARYILIHSPLLGPFSWSAAAAELTRLGHAVETPALPGLDALAEGADGGFYAAFAAKVAAQLADGEPGILVAHSGAGPLLPAIAARLGGRAAGAIFVDALLPHPGRSWFDTAPLPLRDELRTGALEGWLPAWHEWWPPGALERLVPEAQAREALIAELSPIPAAYFEEPAPAAALDVPAACLRLSGAYDAEAAQAQDRGWPVRRLALDHLAILTRPEPVALALQALAGELPAAAGS